MYKIRNVRPSETKVNKTPYNVTITSRILKRLTISSSKMNIKLHGSLNRLIISKRILIEKILNILLFREKETLSHGQLNPKKVSQRAKIRHKKLITWHPISCFISFFFFIFSLILLYIAVNMYNNNQAFYSQESWGRLEMKPHDPKNRDKTKAKKGGKQRAIKN
jgi:hypothetical protein